MTLGGRVGSGCDCDHEADVSCPCSIGADAGLGLTTNVETGVLRAPGLRVFPGSHIVIRMRDWISV